MSSLPIVPNEPAREDVLSERPGSDLRSVDVPLVVNRDTFRGARPSVVLIRLRVGNEGDNVEVIQVYHADPTLVP